MWTDQPRDPATLQVRPPAGAATNGAGRGSRGGRWACLAWPCLTWPFLAGISPDSFFRVLSMPKFLCASCCCSFLACLHSRRIFLRSHPSCEVHFARRVAWWWGHLLSARRTSSSMGHIGLPPGLPTVWPARLRVQ